MSKKNSMKTDVNYFIGKIQNLSKGLSELEMDDVIKFGEEYGGRWLKHIRILRFSMITMK